MDFIADFEWFSECAYWDAKQYSIWYGTKSYKWECITQEEAKQRKLKHLKPLIELVDQPCYTDNQKIAITSYMYNVGRYAMNIQDYVKACDKDSIVYIMNSYWWTSNWVRMWWLEKRRKIEIAKFTS